MHVLYDNMRIIDFYCFTRKADNALDKELSRNARRTKDDRIAAMQLLERHHRKEVCATKSNRRLLVAKLSDNQIFPIMKIRFHACSLYKKRLEEEDADRYNDNKRQDDNFDNFPQKSSDAIHFFIVKCFLMHVSILLARWFVTLVHSMIPQYSWVPVDEYLSLRLERFVK